MRKEARFLSVKVKEYAMRKVDCVIVGGGSAGMSCAIAIARFGIKDILVFIFIKKNVQVLNMHSC